LNLTFLSQAMDASGRRALLLLLVLAALMSGQTARIDGERAMRVVEDLVRIGPRSAGSEKLEATRRYIEEQAKSVGLTVTRQAFEAATPIGKIPMANLVIRIPGTNNPTGARVLLSGHYDTKRYLDRDFVGANDGGSSTALLLEFAQVLAKKPPKVDVWIVFFDGEEAIGTWTATDSLYGSKHMALELRRTGDVPKIRAVINVDMIGDGDLQLVNEHFSTEKLRNLAHAVAREMGKPELFAAPLMPLDDDHVPFLRLGMPAIDLIDFDYGPQNSYWHTEADTLDKLAASSFVTVGELVLRMLERLESEP
jgi:glutaminyl-peptide cyclotransferase